MLDVKCFQLLPVGFLPHFSSLEHLLMHFHAKINIIHWIFKCQHSFKERRASEGTGRQKYARNFLHRTFHFPGPGNALLSIDNPQFKTDHFSTMEALTFPNVMDMGNIVRYKDILN